MAAVRAAPGLDTEALSAYVRQRQGAAAPRRIAVLDDLPRTLLGKVDKGRLRQLLDGQEGGPAYEPPSTPTGGTHADTGPVPGPGGHDEGTEVPQNLDVLQRAHPGPPVNTHGTADQAAR
jgi:hypothetical protein